MRHTVLMGGIKLEKRLGNESRLSSLKGSDSVCTFIWRSNARCIGGHAGCNTFDVAAGR